MRWYSIILIGGVIGFIGIAGYFFLARSLVGNIVHLANIVQDIRAPDLLTQLGRTRISEFAKLEAPIIQLHQLLQRLDEQSVALQTLATERELARQEALRQSLIDPLTQVANRRYLFQTWKALAHQGLEPGDPVAVVMLDLDYFKLINDQYGHAAGDAVLIETAARLKQGLRPGALVARIGGEEFSIVLTGPDAGMAVIIAERLRQSISAQPCRGPRDLIAVTASIGVTVATYSDSALEQLLSQADSALYQAKEGGRNRVVEYRGD